MGTIWFCLVAVMLAGYVVLDGFDIGVGILHLWIARTEAERRALLRSIGSVWDGNEVWLLAAGGTLYFSFPALYAASFSGFYLPLMMVSVAADPARYFARVSQPRRRTNLVRLLGRYICTRQYFARSVLRRRAWQCGPRCSFRCQRQFLRASLDELRPKWRNGNSRLVHDPHWSGGFGGACSPRRHMDCLQDRRCAERTRCAMGIAAMVASCGADRNRHRH